MPQAGPVILPQAEPAMGKPAARRPTRKAPLFTAWHCMDSGQGLPSMCKAKAFTPLPRVLQLCTVETMASSESCVERSLTSTMAQPFSSKYSFAGDCVTLQSGTVARRLLAYASMMSSVDSFASATASLAAVSVAAGSSFSIWAMATTLAASAVPDLSPFSLNVARAPCAAVRQSSYCFCAWAAWAQASAIWAQASPLLSPASWKSCTAALAEARASLLAGCASAIMSVAAASKGFLPLTRLRIWLATFFAEPGLLSVRWTL
mmetsp:Transcript_142551/g.443322  ORF Transcript_142551/g.443322 Transcript_142551/m.443322 type:complete len:262 (-) Transcript_142551:762-1547(-)